jgi:hypothetical protein
MKSTVQFVLMCTLVTCVLLMSVQPVTAKITCYACNGVSTSAGTCSPPYNVVASLGTPVSNCSYCQTFEQPTTSSTTYFLTCGTQATAPSTGCTLDTSTGTTGCTYTCTTNNCIAGPPSTAQTTEQAAGTGTHMTPSGIHNLLSTMRSGTSGQHPSMKSFYYSIATLTASLLLINLQAL